MQSKVGTKSLFSCPKTSFFIYSIASCFEMFSLFRALITLRNVWNLSVEILLLTTLKSCRPSIIPGGWDAEDSWSMYGGWARTLDCDGAFRMYDRVVVVEGCSIIVCCCSASAETGIMTELFVVLNPSRSMLRWD